MTKTKMLKIAVNAFAKAQMSKQNEIVFIRVDKQIAFRIWPP